MRTGLGCGAATLGTSTGSTSNAERAMLEQVVRSVSQELAHALGRDVDSVRAEIAPELPVDVSSSRR